MKRLPAFALLVAGLTLPIYAQRSASRGGFSGYSAPSFREGSVPPLPRASWALPATSEAGPVWSLASVEMALPTT
jgi:hypothetical protein